MIPNEPHIVDNIRRALDLSNLGLVRPLGDAADPWAFDVNGLFIARVLTERDDHTGVALEREAALLAMLARISPIPIPHVVAIDPSAGLTVYRRIPGTSLFENPAPEPQAISNPLADLSWPPSMGCRPRLRLMIDAEQVSEHASGGR